MPEAFGPVSPQGRSGDPATAFLQAFKLPQASFDEVPALAPAWLVEIGREIRTPTVNPSSARFSRC